MILIEQIFIQIFAGASRYIYPAACSAAKNKTIPQLSKYAIYFAFAKQQNARTYTVILFYANKTKLNPGIY